MLCNSCANTPICKRAPYMTDDDSYCPFGYDTAAFRNMLDFKRNKGEVLDLLGELLGYAEMAPCAQSRIEELSDRYEQVREWLA